MDDEKNNQLAKSEFLVGSVTDFLNLTQDQQTQIKNTIVTYWSL